MVQKPPIYGEFGDYDCFFVFCFFKPTLAVSDVFVVALVAHECMEAPAS
jgi:hypothetical protein